MMANQYSGPGAEAYQEAAQVLRCPFWDWASSPSLPAAATVPTFSINGSLGPVSVRNPLYSYQFQHFPFRDPDFAAELAQFNESKRCTPKKPHSDGVDNFSESSRNLTEDGSWLRDQVVGLPPSPLLLSQHP